ncbi:hypothetical protein VTN96DRAFT_9625 [Rasamsonia emersonii]
MELLDLPLEVFRAILEETVIVLGADRAPRLRLVNKFFDGEVIRVVCITGILDSSHLTYGPWLAYHLQSRVLAPRAQDNNNYLLCTLRRVVDELIAKYQGDEHERKREISLALSRAAAEYLGYRVPNALRGCETRSGVRLPKRSSVAYVSFLRSYEFEQSILLGKGQTSDAPEHLLSPAAYVGDVSLVEGLLAQGVDVNAGSNVFGKPLFAAASAGHLDIVRLLLARGADADDGAYPRTEDDERRLLESGDSQESTELHITCTRRLATALDAAAIGGYEEVVRLLLQPEFGISRSTYSYRAAIIKAARGGNANVMRLLIEAGEFSAIPEEWLWECALQQAAEAGQPDTVRLMLERRARGRGGRLRG